ncbi:30S ribosomal protein S2 [Patescibacteria group bacterium]
MKEISLQELLEAGCHFGHKSERWHPKASKYIYTKKDGIHIIDLAKTKEGLQKAAEFLYDLVSSGGEVIFVATKRQAKGVVKEAAQKAGVHYFAERWIGGYLTNWDEIGKNIDKTNRMEEEKKDGSWKKFPKHEQVRMDKHLTRNKMYYEGVLSLKTKPGALFVVDVRKEIAAVKEAKKCGIPVIAIVDTNSDPRGLEYVIPANDDAVGSIKYITDILCSAYSEGLKYRSKKDSKKSENEVKNVDKSSKNPQVTDDKVDKSNIMEEKIEKNEKNVDEKKENKVSDDKKISKPKKRGRPKKSS